MPENGQKAKYESWSLRGFVVRPLTVGVVNTLVLYTCLALQGELKKRLGGVGVVW
jgi:hypothetical protein